MSAKRARMALAAQPFIYPQAVPNTYGFVVLLFITIMQYSLTDYELFMTMNLLCHGKNIMYFQGKIHLPS